MDGPAIFVSRPTDADPEPARTAEPAGGHRLRRAIKWMFAPDDGLDVHAADAADAADALDVAEVAEVADAAPTPEDPASAAAWRRLHRLRRKVATGIVLVSIVSACAGWRASVHEELSGQDDAQFRQQLVLAQQSERSASEAVAQELVLFGSYQEHAVGAQSMANQAVTAAGHRNRGLATQLRISAADERSLAAADLTAFHVGSTSQQGGSYTYDPVAAYQTSIAADPEAGRYRPADQRRRATTEHIKGVDLTGVAALFIAALVLLTFAEVVGGNRPAPGQVAPITTTRVFAASGAGVALLAGVLFMVVGM